MVFAIAPFFFPYILQTYPHEDSKDPLLKINLDPLHPKPQILQPLDLQRKSSSYNAKRKEANSFKIKKRQDNFPGLQPDGLSQILNIHAGNFGNLPSFKSLRVPDYPEENRASSALLNTSPQVNLHKNPLVPSHQPQSSEVLPLKNVPAPVYASNLRPIHVKAPVPVNRPLKYLAEPLAPITYTARASAETPTATSASATQPNLASDPVSVPAPVSAKAGTLRPDSTTTHPVVNSNKTPFTTFAPNKPYESETS